jgi:mannose-1-phosphate guanylyltransferase
MQVPNHVWAIVLAGGDGSRVRDLTTGPNGDDAPKQYCSFGESRSLLGLALARAGAVVSPGRLVTVVAEQHRPWWEIELGSLHAAIPAENVVVQPRNCGTAAGILLGLLRIVSRHGSLVRVLVLPSDHYVCDEETLSRYLEEGILATQRDPSRVVLLGVTAEAPEPECGWILSSAPHDGGVARPVIQFLEKPDAESTQRLLERQALLNTFIFAARAATLLLLYQRALPELLRGLLPRLSRPEAWEPDVLRRLYLNLPTHDFSTEVLARCTGDLSVLPVPPCGWTDLGTPARLHRFQQQRAVEARGRASDATRARVRSSISISP